MVRTLRLWALLLCSLPVTMGLAQQAPADSLVLLQTTQQRLTDSTVQLRIVARPATGVRLFSARPASPDALASLISWDSTATDRLRGPLQETGNAATLADSSLGASAQYFTDSVVWLQTVAAQAADSLVLKGTASLFVQQGDAFLPAEQPVRFTIKPASDAAASGQPTGEERSLFTIFLLAFGGGLLALLTPCVYSMIPVTVSFFTKRSATRSQGIRQALVYAASIVAIFTGLGFAITLIFGPAALNNLATNWVANLVFFAVFLVFGISFLGAFDINLPSSWSSKADSKAGNKSYLGIFFMALTLVVVSFSCTGPIIGNLLVLAARGSWWGPLTGMFGFSLALALPFALFAFFPSRLSVLGKAGGWLNAVKVTLGFLELALALKFLSNADLVKGWRLLDREVFISLWVVIFVLLGMYLLGKLRFHHDDELPKNDFGLPYVSIPRLFFAMASLAFAVYMVPGLWGAPLKGISAFVPPMGTQDFTGATSVSAVGNNTHSNSGLPQPVKYYDRMKIYEPEVVVKYGLVTYFDYQEALQVARQQGKPLMLDFTGINCVNCRKMEGEVWSHPEVMKRLKENFVIASLYVDVQDIDLPEEQHVYSEALGKKIITLGDHNADFQVRQFGANSQPYYFFLDAQEKRLLPEGYGYDPDVDKFIALLDEAVAKYKAK